VTAALEHPEVGAAGGGGADREQQLARGGRRDGDVAQLEPLRA
jgi:hypothetical protein